MSAVHLRWSPAVLLLLSALAFEYSGLDQWVLAACFSTARGDFIARGTVWGDKLLHDGGARAVLIAAVALLLMMVAGIRRERDKPYRDDLIYLLLCVALTTGLVALLKHFSPVHCPVQWQRYGGDVQGITWLQVGQGRVIDAIRAGHCFPGGHSSGAWAWFGSYWIARRRQWSHALPVLCCVVVTGLLFSATQWVRGAHFPSHDIVSAALAWSVASALDALRQPAVDRHRQTEDHASPRRVVDDLAIPVVQQHHGSHQR